MTGLDSRQDYTIGTLEMSDLLENPISQLKTWLEIAVQAGVTEPNAMTLCTVAANNRPSSRVVLLRRLDDQGLTFFTNYQSRKGQDLLETGFACLNFWWAALERQVRVDRIEPIRLGGEHRRQAARRDDLGRLAEFVLQDRKSVV